MFLYVYNFIADMKKSILISTVFLFSLLFAGCNKNDSFDGNDQTSVELLYNLATDQDRLKIYLKESVTVRATSFSAIVIPEVPADAKPMYGTNDAWQATEGDSFIIETGESFNGGLVLNNNDYYVYGELTLGNHWGAGGGTIYVLPTGKVNVTTGVLSSKVRIVNTGILVLPETFAINPDAAVYTNTDIAAGTMDVSGRLYSEAAVSVNNFYLKNSGFVDLKGCLVISDALKVTNTASLKVGSYLSADNIELNSSGSFFMEAGSYISCNVLNVENQTAYLRNEGDDYAVIECNELVIHQADQTKSTGWLDIHAGTITNLTGTDIQWLSTVIFDGETYIPADGCSPGFGEQSDKEHDYKLDHLAKVESANERISATSVGFRNGKAYVSWHRYGEAIEGYIDVVDMGTLNLDATLYSEVLDFNHISVDGQYIYVAGGRRTGAFIGKVGYDGSSAIDIELTALHGSSGNCVLVDNEKIWAVSGANGGLSILDESNLTYHTMPYAKYVLKQGDRMVVLSDVTNAKLSYFDLTGALVNEYPVGSSITPTGGKNAMATDGETVYVALGGNGLKAIKNGTVVAEFSNESNNGGFANGVDVDDKFVYVANGNGLYILNKTDLSEIMSYHLAGASANFVKKGDDGLLYVSYGLNGVNVFRFIEE